MAYTRCRDCDKLISNPSTIKSHILADFLLQHKGLYTRYSGYTPNPLTTPREALWNIITLPKPWNEYQYSELSYRDRLNQIIEVQDYYYLWLPPFRHLQAFKTFKVLFNYLDGTYADRGLK